VKSEDAAASFRLGKLDVLDDGGDACRHSGVDANRGRGATWPEGAMKNCVVTVPASAGYTSNCSS
jgi:hypothetical protein